MTVNQGMTQEPYFGASAPSAPENPQFENSSNISQTSRMSLSRMDAYGVMSIIFSMLLPIVSVFTGWIAWKRGDSEFSITLGKWSFIISIVSIILFVLYFVGVIIFAMTVGLMEASVETY